MEADRRERLKQLLEQAHAHPIAGREAFLRGQCRQDASLLDEALSLMPCYEPGEAYFDRLAGDVLPFLNDAPPGRDEPAPDPMIGRRIAQYEITEKLGGGGMGVVYKAHHKKLGRDVALKFLPPRLSPDDEAKARFAHEAKAASALDHPHICTIYDIGETDSGQFFIAMAYYAGETLKHQIARGPLPVEAALTYAMQVAEGLSKAHGKGIVHRDVKPANVMVTEEGVVKLVDFGVAKMAEQALDLTQAGSRVGTVAYMSPEQA